MLILSYSKALTEREAKSQIKKILSAAWPQQEDARSLRKLVCNLRADFETLYSAFNEGDNIAFQGNFIHSDPQSEDEKEEEEDKRAGNITILGLTSSSICNLTFCIPVAA